MRSRQLMSLSALLLLLLINFTVVSCNDMSIMIEDDDAGFNGSFETTQDGIPVNWLIYAPQTVPDSDFDLTLDTTDPFEGQVSMHFDVRACSNAGGWYSPGIDKEMSAMSGVWYKVMFCVKNDGATFRASVGGISDHGGDMTVLVSTDQSYDEWTMLEYDYLLPAEFDRIRFQLNILEPGQFWVDDISITALPKID